jgi:hypothetical protein
MPYKSPEQRAYLHINEPEVAAKWDAELRSQDAEMKAKPKKKSKSDSLNHQKSLADGIRKSSASTSTAGSAVGGGT